MHYYCNKNFLIKKKQYVKPTEHYNFHLRKDSAEQVSYGLHEEHQQ